MTTRMRFTEENIAAIVKILRTVDEDARVTCSYSGRGMYGETCVGFVAQTTHLVLAAVIEVMRPEGVSALEVGDAMYTDNMGLSFIGYFPFSEYVREPNGEPVTVSDVDDLDDLDWELPVDDSRFPFESDEEFAVKLALYFQEFNNVRLEGKAYLRFLDAVDDYYRTD